MRISDFATSQEHAVLVQQRLRLSNAVLSGNAARVVLTD